MSLNSLISCSAWLHRHLSFNTSGFSISFLHKLFLTNLSFFSSHQAEIFLHWLLPDFAITVCQEPCFLSDLNPGPLLSFIIMQMLEPFASDAEFHAVLIHSGFYWALEGLSFMFKYLHLRNLVRSSLPNYSTLYTLAQKNLAKLS